MFYLQIHISITTQYRVLKEYKMEYTGNTAELYNNYNNNYKSEFINIQCTHI